MTYELSDIFCKDCLSNNQKDSRVYLGKTKSNPIGGPIQRAVEFTITNYYYCSNGHKWSEEITKK